MQLAAVRRNFISSPAIGRLFSVIIEPNFTTTTTKARSLPKFQADKPEKTLKQSAVPNLRSKKDAQSLNQTGTRKAQAEGEKSTVKKEKAAENAKAPPLENVEIVGITDIGKRKKEKTTVPQPKIVTPEQMDTTAAPVTVEEFEKLLNQADIHSGVPLGLAISGGPDSMALLRLCASWAKKTGARVIAFTVDHAFRPESKAEAMQVKEWATALGVKHFIIPVVWKKPVSQAQKMTMGRAERYRLLIEQCNKHNLQALVMAHQKEDQLETFLMRFSMMSGIDGLGCMNARRELLRFPVIRPFLSLSKQNLIATCQKYNQSYLQDPTNTNDIFLRSRARIFMQEFTKRYRYNFDKLLPLMDFLENVRTSLSIQVDKFLVDNCYWNGELGHARIPRKALQKLDILLQHRVWSRLILHIGGKQYPPSLNVLKRMSSDLMAPARFPTITSSGCIAFQNEAVSEQESSFESFIWFVTECSNTKKTVITSGETVMWNDVWEIFYEHRAKKQAYIVQLSPAAWQTYLKYAPKLRKLKRFPPLVRKSLPIILDTETHKLLAIPYLNIYWAPGVKATLTFKTLTPLLSSSQIVDLVEESDSAQ